jgi:hypothetical protein
MNAKEAIKTVNRFKASKPVEKAVKTYGGSDVNASELIALMRSENGCSEVEAGVLIYGSRENFDQHDSEGKQTRNRLRNLMRSNANRSKGEIPAAHTGSVNKITYFIIKDSEKAEFVDHWRNQGVKPKFYL